MKSKKQLKEEKIRRKKKNQIMRIKHIERKWKISGWYRQRRDMETTTLVTGSSDQNRRERNKREKKKNKRERRKDEENK